MNTGDGNRRPRNVSLVLGSILILVGLLFIVGQLINIRIEHFVWPFYIIIPGVLLFIFALTTEGSGSEALVILGSLVTMVGLILLYQNTFDHYESWAYAWALIPFSVGLGQIIYGSVKGRELMVVNGRRLIAIGGVIFFVGAVFFELIIGISGFGLGSYAWPILLIGLGVLILLRSWWPRLPTTSPQARVEPENPTQKLNQLKEMLNEGLITEAEYETKKTEILGGM